MKRRLKYMPGQTGYSKETIPIHTVNDGTSRSAFSHLDVLGD